ncbi:MAG: hypothetical protein A3E88_05920 [Legionellales bacterium RIFCSPHIGHO2_12_FULL_35_11]|nr:MAG: hypothetical protein A3E88_05920 [Legionellales bacterium RIFCSPHIGHO2_12_FULL_35_11]
MKDENEQSTTDKNTELNLYEKALNLIQDQDFKKNFDPQGRLLVEVDNVLVSLDLAHTDKYKEWVGNGLENVDKTKKEKIISALTNLDSLNSIIFLQQEMHFQLLLASRVYSELYSINQEESEKAHAEAMSEVNGLVNKAFSKALVAACDDSEVPKLDIETINKKLNESRASIFPKAHEILVNNLSKIVDVPINEANFDRKQAKNLAKKTTASDLDILHIDRTNKIAIRIGGTKNTAHDKQLGEKLAAKSICYFKIDDKLCFTKVDKTHVRVPSIAVVEGVPKKEQIADVVDKLEYISIQNRFEKPFFTYNLLTALDDYADEMMTKNKQNASLDAIILGAHAYNKKCLSLATKPCMVQAISVNGFGKPLGYSRFPFGNNLKHESTQMTEMSLIRNIDEKFFNEKISNRYENFLQPANKGIFSRFFQSPYFYQSNDGRAVVRAIALKKKEWKGSFNDTAENPAKTLVEHSLKKIMAFDLHFSHKYAKLIQALSLFAEDEAIFGCKSANERTVIIANRENMLEHEIPRDLRNKFIALCNASSKKEAKNAAEALKESIDYHYNKENLYGAAALIPLSEGAGHKIESQPKIFNLTKTYNRNFAEGSNITNLKQSNVGKAQAHKGFVDYMADGIKHSNKIVMDGDSTTRMMYDGVAAASSDFVIESEEDIQAESAKEKNSKTHPSSESLEENADDTSNKHPTDIIKHSNF